MCGVDSLEFVRGVEYYPNVLIVYSTLFTIPVTSIS